MYASEEWTSKEKSSRPFLDTLQKASGIENVTLKEIWRINDPLTCEKAHGLPVPPALDKPDVIKQLKELSDWALVKQFGGSHDHATDEGRAQFHRITAGRMLGELAKYLNASAALDQNKDKLLISGDTAAQPKFVFWSSHDTTLAALLASLGAFELDGPHSRYPPYASTVIFELWAKDDGKGGSSYYVTTHFHNGTSSSSVNSAIAISPTAGGKACDLKCPLGDFVKALEPVQLLTPADWESECGNESGLEQLRRGIITGMLIGIVIGMVGVACTLLVRKHCCSGGSGGQYTNMAEHQPVSGGPPKISSPSAN